MTASEAFGGLRTEPTQSYHAPRCLEHTSHTAAGRPDSAALSRPDSTISGGMPRTARSGSVSVCTCSKHPAHPACALGTGPSEWTFRVHTGTEVKHSIKQPLSGQNLFPRDIQVGEVIELVSTIERVQRDMAARERQLVATLMSVLALLPASPDKLSSIAGGPFRALQEQAIHSFWQPIAHARTLLGLAAEDWESSGLHGASALLDQVLELAYSEEPAVGNSDRS